MEGKEFIQVQVTFPDEETARETARNIVENGYAACVQMIPINSVYRWEGKVNENGEMLLLIKAARENYQSIEKEVLRIHPYQVPEITSLKIDEGSEKYLNWVDDMCRII